MELTRRNFLVALGATGAAAVIPLPSLAVAGETPVLVYPSMFTATSAVTGARLETFVAGRPLLSSEYKWDMRWLHNKYRFPHSIDVARAPDDLVEALFAETPDT